jgi:hypothetical protein
MRGVDWHHFWPTPLLGRTGFCPGTPLTTYQKVLEFFAEYDGTKIFALGPHLAEITICVLLLNDILSTMRSSALSVVVSDANMFGAPQRGRVHRRAARRKLGRLEIFLRNVP